MEDFKNKPEPKKIKMPPLVDRYRMYDTMEFDNDTLPDKNFLEDLKKHNENNSENNSESIQ